MMIMDSKGLVNGGKTFSGDLERPWDLDLQTKRLVTW
jgi:hypothetical protein